MGPRALSSRPRLFVDNFLRSKFDVHFNEFEVISFNENTLAETGICLLSWMKMCIFDAMVILAKVGHQIMSGESRQVSKYLAYLAIWLHAKNIVKVDIPEKSIRDVAQMC